MILIIHALTQPLNYLFPLYTTPPSSDVTINFAASDYYFDLFYL